MYTLHVDNLLDDKWDNVRLEEDGFNLIYIDPPYNTGRQFNYGDHRDKSEYYTLVEKSAKRIKEHLSDNGWCAVQIDDRELITWKTFLDKELGEDNFVNCIVVKMSELSGVKMAHVNSRLPKVKEYILLYRKSSASQLNPVRVPKERDKLERYAKYYSTFVANPLEPCEQWKLMSVKQAKSLLKEDLDDLSFKIKYSKNMIYRTNSPLSEGKPKESIIKEMKDSKEGIWYLWEGKRVLFLSDYLEENLGDLWTDISTIGLSSETFGLSVFKNGQKPLKLIERIISMTTPKDGKVLDFFAGSGTTGCAVANLNAKGEKRTVHLFQQDESIPKSSELYKVDGFTKIHNLTEERIKRCLNFNHFEQSLLTVKL